MSHPCDVVKVKFIFPYEQHYRHAIWVGTNICLGYFLWLEGDLKQGMQARALGDYALIYPSSRYPTEFIGTIELAKLGDFHRVWRGVEPPRKQLDEQGQKLVQEAPLFDAEDWVRVVIEALWNERVLAPAVETRVLLGSYPGYLDGYTDL